MSRLVTPEAVELDLPIATVATRALGRLLDLALQVAALVLVLVGTDAAAVDDTATLVVGLLAVFLVRIVYPIALETRFGATLGQRAMGLRIVTDDGGPIRLRQAFVRAAVGLFEIDMTGGLVAFTTAAARADGKRLGDVAAGTLAVSVRVGTSRADVLGVGCPPGLEPWAATLDTSGLTTAHRSALRRFHERSRTLPPDRAAALARPLLDRLLVVLATTRPPGAGDVALLEAIEWAAGEATSRDVVPRPPLQPSAGPRGTPDPDAVRPVPPPPPGATPDPPARGGDDAGFAPPS